jgi:hypothetical protein
MYDKPFWRNNKSVKFMARVKQISKGLVKQIGLAARFLGFWLHFESKFARN